MYSKVNNTIIEYVAVTNQGWQNLKFSCTCCQKKLTVQSQKSVSVQKADLKRILYYVVKTVCKSNWFLGKVKKFHMMQS